MGKKTPKAPAAPDPYATAQAQGEMNVNTAIANANLNRINQYTPEGSLEFRQIGTNADGTPKYASYQQYSPEQQTLYNNQNAVSNALSALSLQNVNRVAQAQSTPFDTSGMTPYQILGGGGPIQGGYGAGGQINYGYDPGGQARYGYQGGGDITRGIAGAGGIQGGYGSGGAIQGQVANNAADYQRTYGTGGNVQGQLDFSGLTEIPGIGDYGAEAKRVQDSVYNQATSRLDPRFEQEQRQLATSLAGKGVSENSEAYRRAMDQFTRQKTDAYNQATYSGIQAGSQEQSRLFGLALAGRQQGVGERTAQGQFANAAQSQLEAQNAARASFGNQAASQIFGQNLAAGQFANTAQQQGEAQAAARAAFGNQAQQQQFAQNAAQSQFANQAQQQANDQSMQQAAFYNAAQQQQNQQNAAAQAFYNTAQGQQNAQNMQAAAFGNQAQQQAYQQQLAQAQFNNQVRNQQMQEQAYLRNLPLNEIAALMGTSGGVSQPNYANYASANVGGVDYSGLVQNNFNNQMSLYQQKLAQQNAGLGSVFGLLGNIGGAAMMASDRRLKKDINAVGRLANGLKTYVFKYIGDHATRFGVMADEVLSVRPEAVVTMPSGYLAVDYRKVW